MGTYRLKSNKGQNISKKLVYDHCKSQKCNIVNNNVFIIEKEDIYCVFLELTGVVTDEFVKKQQLFLLIVFIIILY